MKRDNTTNVQANNNGFDEFGLETNHNGIYSKNKILDILLENHA